MLPSTGESRGIQNRSKQSLKLEKMFFVNSEICPQILQRSRQLSCDVYLYLLAAVAFCFINGGFSVSRSFMISAKKNWFRFEFVKLQNITLLFEFSFVWWRGDKTPC